MTVKPPSIINSTDHKVIICGLALVIMRGNRHSVIYGHNHHGMAIILSLTNRFMIILYPVQCIPVLAYINSCSVSEYLCVRLFVARNKLGY